MNLKILRLLAVGLYAWSMSASAAIIRENLLGTITSTPDLYWGESVVTGVGTSWNNLHMNFYSGATPIAFGTLYMFGAQYSGSPSGLAASSFLASAADAGSTWDFAPSVSILANTEYWFYSDTVLTGSLTGGTSSGVAGEGHFVSSGANSNFSGRAGPGINFTLTGTPGATPVPEPATIALLSLGLAGLGFSRRKQ